MIDINELRQNIITYGLESTCADDLIGLLGRLEAAEKEVDALRAKITEMEKQEPVAWRWELKTGQYTYVDKPEHAGKNARIVPLYALPGAKGEEK